MVQSQEDSDSFPGSVEGNPVTEVVPGKVNLAEVIWNKTADEEGLGGEVPFKEKYCVPKAVFCYGKVRRQTAL